MWSLARMVLVGVVVSAGAAALAQATRPAATEPATIVSWKGKDVAGGEVRVPGERATLMLFVRAGQAQSREALKRVKAALRDAQGVQAIAVLSGQQQGEDAKFVNEDGPWAGKIVVDPEYEMSGAMSVHVWPTTVLVNGKGELTGHMGGMSYSFAKELDAQLAYAAGKIDRGTLAQRLVGSDEAPDTAEQKAGRHLQVAQRLLEQDQVDAAKAELEEGLKLQPKSGVLMLSLAQVLVENGDVRGAEKLLDEMDKSSVPGWQVSFVRARVLVTQEKWEEAKGALTEALKLNPNPGQVQYQLGLVYQRQGDWQKAAEAFRAAAEGTVGRRQLVTTRP
jgi:tetratricopeptide (TPR) repeat protein